MSSKAHDRIVEIDVTAAKAAETVVVTAVKYYRDRAMFDAGIAKPMVITASAAAANAEVQFGQLLPPPTHIRIKSTFVA